MTNPPTQVSVSEEERLDDDTEMAIQVHANSYKVIGLDRRSHIGQINAANALRKRIRTLIEEARKDATRGWMLVGPASTIFPKRESSDV